MIKLKTFALLAAILAASILVSGLFAESKPQEGKREIRVLASTGWTAAFVRAAGFKEVRVLAPYELKHPPEYELKPSDVAAAGEADFIVYAGYERMVTKLLEATGNKKAKLLKITTQNDFATIEASVGIIAAALGTKAAAEKNLAELKAFFDGWKEELRRSGAYGLEAAVHFHQVPLMKDLGFSLAGTFGPGPLEAAKILALAEKKPRLIVDNRHNEIAKPLAESLKTAKVVSLYNFPNSAKTPDLIDLLKTNKAFLDAALR